MKRYFDLKDFITFLNLLEDNKVTPLFTESVEDGSIEKHNFMKMMFSGNTIILYDHPMCQTGIIQDSPVAPWDDYAEGVWEDLIREDEYKVFIEGELIKTNKNYPPNGKYYMYPCYDSYNNLIGFSSDYDANGAYGKLCVIKCEGLYKR